MSDNTNTVDEISPDEQAEQVDALDLVADSMRQFRDEMEYFDNLGTKIAARTRSIMRTVFAILIVCALYLVVMIFDMASKMGVMTTNLEDMYGRFGTMSEDMRAITRTVDSMGRSIEGIPHIAGVMSTINEDVSLMSSSVYGMNDSVIGMDNDMVHINSSMHEMTGRLSNMSRSVNLMTYDVNEMAAPANMGPFSGFWPTR